MSGSAQRLLASKANKTKTLGEEYAEKAQEILDKRVFAQQRELILDPSRHKVARCPRRAGKTQTVLHYALYVMLCKPNASVLIVLPRSKQSRTVYFIPFQRLCESLGIECLPLSNQLMARLKNGSVIQFGSADTADDVEAYRGNGYDLVVIDECDTFSYSMFETMVMEIFEWALLDRNGALVCIGTPGYVLQGPFYAIQTGDVEGAGLRRDGEEDGDSSLEMWRSRHWDERKTKNAYWSLHTWSLKDNVFAPDAWKRALEKKEVSGQADNDPRWLVEGLGIWASYTTDDHVFIYGKVSKAAQWHAGQELPEGHKWRTLLSVDPGSTAATGFVVGIFAEDHPTLYFVHSEKHEGMMIDDQAAKILELQKQWGPFEAIIIDNAAAEHIKQFQTRFRIPVVPCDNKKIQTKSETAELINADLSMGRIRLDSYGELAKEWRNLLWKDKTRKTFKLHSIDHCSDAAIYLWRYSRHNYKRTEAKVDAPVFGTKEYYEAEQQKDLQERLARQAASKAPLSERNRAKRLGAIRDVSGRANRWSNRPSYKS